MPLTSRPLAPQHASTRCLMSVLLSTQFAMKRRGAGCGDVRLGCWQIAGTSGHRRLSVIARLAWPEQIFTEAKRRALTPEEAGRLLAGLLPLFWWDPILTLLGTGLRFGELAGLRRRRVHLNRPIEPCRITLSFTRWPLALLLSKPRACPQSPPRPGTLTCAGT